MPPLAENLRNAFRGGLNRGSRSSRSGGSALQVVRRCPAGRGDQFRGCRHWRSQNQSLRLLQAYGLGSDVEGLQGYSKHRDNYLFDYSISSQPLHPGGWLPANAKILKRWKKGALTLACKFKPILHVPPDLPA